MNLGERNTVLVSLSVSHDELAIAKIKILHSQSKAFS
jgi:hypothetical protein